MTDREEDVCPSFMWLSTTLISIVTYIFIVYLYLDLILDCLSSK